MKLDKKDLIALCDNAEQAAKAAGEYIQSKCNKSYQSDRKQGGSSLAAQVVTEVDIKAQELVLSYLQASIKHYNLGLLAEESADDASRFEKPYFWCIDPLDGTLPFTEGRTGYAVSIALVDQSGDPVVGAVYVPDLELCYSALKGNGVYLNNELVKRDIENSTSTLEVYMDQSLQVDPLFEKAKSTLERWAVNQRLEAVNYHVGFGAVRNALAVMHSSHGCYFKFPKNTPGGGSIWDFAATRLFFEELGLHVSNAQGERLHLNAPDTTFIHQQGVIYATDKSLADQL